MPLPSTIEDPLRDIPIPPEFVANLQRHREHLACLVATLRSAGVDEAQIELSVSTIIASYKEELLRSTKALLR